MKVAIMCGNELIAIGNNIPIDNSKLTAKSDGWEKIESAVINKIAVDLFNPNELPDFSEDEIMY